MSSKHMNECLLTFLKCGRKTKTTYMAGESLAAPPLPPTSLSPCTSTPPSPPRPQALSLRTLASSQLAAQARVFLCGVGRHVLPSPRKVLICLPYLENSYPAFGSQLKWTLPVPCTRPPLNWSPPVSSLSALILLPVPPSSSPAI